MLPNIAPRSRSEVQQSSGPMGRRQEASVSHGHTLMPVADRDRNQRRFERRRLQVQRILSGLRSLRLQMSVQTALFLPQNQVRLRLALRGRRARPTRRHPPFVGRPGPPAGPGRQEAILSSEATGSCPWSSARAALFGIGNDVADDVCVVHDVEIKTPVLVDPRLPEIDCFVIFLRP